ncbi:MAG: hypothetical protein IKE20_07690 [Eggerthellaceae bacterium]|nr:hypothetical protein [Eggerthellaceae bacterium]MBR3160050.1 hypothetical protein [Atopobiaceae bacterium]
MYDVTMRIQDINSNEYECPFEARFVDEDLAQMLFDKIVQNGEFWHDTICERYGLADEDEPWIQLFLTDDVHECDMDEDEYWMSYEVL